MNKAFIAEARSHRSSCKSAMRSQHIGILAFVGRALKIFGERVAEARRMHQAYEELAAMSDRELKDIGITRNDIPAVVARTYHRARPAVSNVITLDQPCGLRSPGAHNQPHGSLQMHNCQPGPEPPRTECVEIGPSYFAVPPLRMTSKAASRQRAVSHPINGRPPLVRAIAKRAVPSKE